jgi:hypothetical protein
MIRTDGIATESGLSWGEVVLFLSLSLPLVLRSKNKHAANESESDAEMPSD